VNLFDICTGRVSRINHVKRYSSFPVLRPENVAEHSWWVAFIALIISDTLADQGIEVHTEILLRRALVHDVDEVMSGDVIRSFKHTNEGIAEVMHIASNLNMHELTNEWEEAGITPMVDWIEAKDESIEGDIIRFADMATVALYIRSEKLLGNNELGGALQNMYETWFRKFHSHPVLGQFASQLFPNRRWWDMYRCYTDLGQAAIIHPIMREPDSKVEPVAAHDFSNEDQVPLG
jgi:5'-deoxynucleotidase YfbR-like HD superfamily hydrolase